MNDVALALRQVVYENRSFWRNPAAAFFTFIMPLMFLVIFNVVFGDERIDRFGGTVSGSQFYVPGIAALSVISAAYTNIAMMVTIARDQGLLKRVRGTPLPAWAFLFGKIVHATLVALLLVAIVTAAGALFYDVNVPTDTMPAFIVTLIVGSASFSALGLAMTGFIRNADAAPAIINGTILPLFFISDIFIPLSDAPAWLRTLGDVFPVKHFSDALGMSFNPFESGSGFDVSSLLIIAAWGLGGVLVAIRSFSWEPRG
ncbi:MAG: ABC transporter permease [Dehalococcoidia bacterium]